MWLIADSGSTKTEWLLYDTATRKSNVISTSGLNPYFIDSEKIEEVLKIEVKTQVYKPVKKIWFYGAGCLADENKNKIKKSLFQVFASASIVVDTDMVGAAYSLCGKNAGIVCILGTGANSCVYNGTTIVKNGNALGFILGDEGSGSYLGKQLVKAYLQQELPLELKEKFDIKYLVTRDSIIDAVYRKPFANRYLATYSVFLYENINHGFCKQIVSDAFRLFFKTNVLIYPEYKSLPVNFIGSVAFYFAEIIQELAKENNIKLGKIAKSPIDGLLSYCLD